MPAADDDEAVARAVERDLRRRYDDRYTVVRSESAQGAIKLGPDAKRVFLTAYADTEVAIRAISEVRPDHYASAFCGGF